jgi:hypothetical protein
MTDTSGEGEHIAHIEFWAVVLSCSKFVTTTDCAPRLHARLPSSSSSSTTPPPMVALARSNATKPPAYASSTC